MSNKKSLSVCDSGSNYTEPCRNSNLKMKTLTPVGETTPLQLEVVKEAPSQAFLDPLFLFQAVGIVAEACYELFLQDKEPPPRFRKVANIINTGVLGWRVFSRIQESYAEYSPADEGSVKESQTEIKFKHTDAMFLLVKNWVTQYASFIDPTAESMTIDLHASLGITGSATTISARPDQFKAMTLDNCVVPTGEVYFKWRGYDIEFISTSKSSIEQAKLPDTKDNDLITAGGKDKELKRWRDLTTPVAAIRINTRDKAVLDELFEDIKSNVSLGSDEKDKAIPEPSVYAYTDYDGWEYLMDVPARAAVLPESYDTALSEDISNFFKNKSWYKSVAVPHRRGYMFYGLPGTGKTSTIITLAKQCSLDVHIINLNKLKNSGQFERAINTANCGDCQGSILVFEDIDCVLSSRDIKASLGGNTMDPETGIVAAAESQLTFSEFLNVIDGITSREDQIIIMTTNKELDDFDAALMRPGRIDVKVHFTYATRYQIVKLVDRFIPDDHETAAKIVKEIENKGPCTMCEVQEFLIQWHFGRTKTL